MALFMWPFKKNKEYEELYKFFRNILGFTPRHIELYHMALLHKSMSSTVQGHRVNNERLEYLGDAVLSSIVAEYLYRKYPYQGEGFLTELRAKLVSRANLNKLAQTIGLTQLVEYNKSSQGVFKYIGGDTFEAMVGAMYLEKGYLFTRKVMVDRILSLYVNVDAMANTDWNFKSKLLDWGQKKKAKVTFQVLREFYPGRDHSRKQYEVCVLINGERQETAIGYSVKSAEQEAAEKTYKRLKSPQPTK
ncbi:MAG: ribonuclease III [Bacteroidales bacterium]|nr:ribonuclease III [Bacteroidales bacterium]